MTAGDKRGAVSWLGVALVFALTLGWARGVRASGFAAARFGGEQGTVLTTNPTALYYNPAGIGMSQGTHLFLDGTLAIRRVTWEHTAAPTDTPEPPGGAGANTGTAKLFNVFGGPALGATMKFGDLAVGAGIFVPFGGRASWSPNSAFEGNAKYPLAADGVQRWHSIDGALTFIYFSVGAAYRLGPVSVGVSGNLISGSVKASQAKNFAGSGDPDLDSEGRSTLDVAGTFGSFGLGAMVEAIPDRLWFGVSYQAQPGMGVMVMKGTLDNQGASGSLSFKSTFTQALPDIYRLGVRYRPSDTFELRLFGDWTRWSVMKSQCVAIEGSPCLVDETGAQASPDGGVLQNLDRRWQDTFGIRAGVSHWLKPEVELFGGVGFETAAVPDATLEPNLPDADNIGVALGGRFAFTPTFFLAASYTHLFYLNRDNTGKSELARINGVDVAPPTRQEDGGGRYTQFIGLFDLNVEKQF